MMADEPRRYLAYLLRLWQSRTGDHLVWRASLEDPHTSQRLEFASLERLVVLLMQQTGDGPLPVAEPNLSAHALREDHHAAERG